MKKRIVSLLLVLSMLLCALPAVSAADRVAPTFTTRSLSLNKSIAINFKVPKDAIEGIFEKAVFTKGDDTYTFYEPSYTDGTYAVFTFDKLAPHELGVKVKAELYTVGGQIGTRETSVLDYCNAVLDDENASGALRTLVVDLLNYGAAFQTYKNQTAGLVNANLPFEHKALATKTDRDLEFNGSRETLPGASVAFKGPGLLLEDCVKFYFRIEKTELLNNLTLKVTSDIGNWSIPASDDYDNVTVDGQACYDIYFDKLDPTQMSDTITAQFYSGDTPVSDAITYSIETYAAKATGNVAELCDYMMKYGDSAKAWVESTVVTPSAENAIFVSAEATAGEGDGSLNDPFATIEEAKTAVRKIKANGTYPAGGITVYFREGVYPVTSTITFTEADSGVEGAPVVYKAYPNEEVEFLGGKSIDASAFTAVANASISARLPYASKVKQFDLKTIGVTNYGQLHVYGMQAAYFRAAGVDIPDEAAPELFFNDTEMVNARYPNEGWLTISSVPDPGDVVQNWSEAYASGTVVPESERHNPPIGSTFIVNGDEVKTRMATWNNASDSWVYGFWAETWADQSMPVASLNPTTGTVTTGLPSGKKMNNTGKFYFYNLLEELDAPGEYYLDRDTGILYAYLPSETGTVTYADLSGNMLRFDSCHDIELVGITLSSGADNGISMSRVQNIVIKDSEITKFAGQAISMNNCRDVTITGCHLHNLGSGGVSTYYSTTVEPYATMFKELTSMGIVIEDCEINNYTRISKTYAPAVITAGVGMTVRNCKIHDGNHMAITLGGNDTLIENNEIYDVLQTTSDSGVLYTGFSKEQMGIVVRNNYIHDISSTAGRDISFVYADDTKDGITVESNLLVNFNGKAVFFNGGWDNISRYNVLINTYSEGAVSSIGMSGTARYNVQEHPNYARFRELKDAPAYQNYPHWAEKVETVFTTNAPKHNVIQGNVLINVTELAYPVCNQASWSEEKILEDNTLEAGRRYKCSTFGFSDYLNGDFTISENAAVFTDISGFAAYDLTKIGLFGEAVEKPGDLGNPDYLVYEEFGYADDTDPATVITSENWANFATVVNNELISFNDGRLNLSAPGNSVSSMITRKFGGVKSGKVCIEFDFEYDDSKLTDKTKFQMPFYIKDSTETNTKCVFVVKNGNMYLGWSSTVYTACAQNQPHHVELIVDMDTRKVDIRLDGNGFATGSQFTFTGDLTAIRFSPKSEDSNATDNAEVYIDNLKVSIY